MFVTMYTNEYAEMADTLKKDYEYFRLPYMFFPINSCGDWLKNCKQNTDVILKAMERTKEDIVYMDADARILKKPVLFDELDCDVAVHIIRYPDKERLQSGTVFFKNCPKVKLLVSEWAKINEENDEFDDDNLYTLIKDVDFVELPAEYCAIHINRIQKLTKEEAVIWHTQASRKLKYKI